jgi:hypothetical protein
MRRSGLAHRRVSSFQSRQTAAQRPRRRRRRLASRVPSQFGYFRCPGQKNSLAHEEEARRCGGAIVSLTTASGRRRPRSNVHQRTLAHTHTYNRPTRSGGLRRRCQSSWTGRARDGRGSPGQPAIVTCIMSAMRAGRSEAARSLSRHRHAPFWASWRRCALMGPPMNFGPLGEFRRRASLQSDKL